MKKKISCILLSCLIILLLSGCSIFVNKKKEILNYLEEKYGSDKNFQFTGEVGGGGVTEDYPHYRMYTSDETNGESFMVKTYRKDGMIDSICDNYLVVKFYDDTKKIYADVLKQLNFNNYIIKPGQQAGRICDDSVVTEDFNEYLNDDESIIWATIIIESYGENIDKDEISNKFIKEFEKLGIINKYGDHKYLARIYFVNTLCDPVSDYYCSHKELFDITKDGYIDRN